jgi:dTDP-4-dehydrorhamnose reductase
MMLVTGATGLLGANFLLEANRRGESIVGITRRHRFAPPPGILIETADLGNEQTLHKIVQTYRPEWIVHFAAETNVDWCETHSTHAEYVNVEIARIVAQVARRLGARMLYMSTDSVFNGARGNYTEADTPSPINVYARTKLEGERAVYDVLPDAAIIRANIFGWNALTRRHLAEWIVAALSQGKMISGFTDVVFTPVLANDLSEILLDSMEANISGLYHIAGSQAVSKYDFATMIAEAFRYDVSLINPAKVSDCGLTAPRPLNTSLLGSAFSTKFGLAAPDLSRAVNRFKEMFQSGEIRRLGSWFCGAEL